MPCREEQEPSNFIRTCQQEQDNTRGGHRPSRPASPPLRLSTTRVEEALHSLTLSLSTLSPSPDDYIRGAGPLSGKYQFPLSRTLHCKHFRAFEPRNTNSLPSETRHMAPSRTSIIPCVSNATTGFLEQRGNKFTGRSMKH